ncbi:MAG TPA: radical SAM family heme chaperone HemW [Terriglobales bacterium]|nr:radical SAM family heme chaperone HemW [Terriglobales bacterium]
MSLGLYISVPFCRSKCSYCNFASGVFSPKTYQHYADRVCADIRRAPELAEAVDGKIQLDADSIYFGGGTPTVLQPSQLEAIFAAARGRFSLPLGSEITVECAPGTLSAAMIEQLVRLGVNRVSLGVQSFVDQEAAAVGRLHTRAIVLEEIARLRGAGITNINVDLIAGLPHQTEESWQASLDNAIAAEAPHVSVYMLEVDDESRLGRELIAGGTRYHAHFVPDDDQVAGFYEMACERLARAGIAQYEISNFAREGFESRHNLKYWTRQPYLGFGVDAHSMIEPSTWLLTAGVNALRFAMPAELEEFLARPADDEPATDIISRSSALEERFFLGLRLTRGVRLDEVEAEFGVEAVNDLEPSIAQVIQQGLVVRHGATLKLTPRGRLLSNEVFDAFVAIGTADDLPELLEYLERTKRDGPEGPDEPRPLTKKVQ